MCLTIPGKIKAIKNGLATVTNGSRTEQIELGIVIDAKVGDWVLYATNRAVRLIDEQEAREIIELLEDNYQPVDIVSLPLRYKKIVYKIRNGGHTKISEKIIKSQFLISNKIPNSKPRYESHLEKSTASLVASKDRNGSDIHINLVDSSQNTQNKSLLATGYSLLTKNDLEYLLELKGANNLEAFYSEANVLRKDIIKDFVCIHGIVEFSNYCKNYCLYCGIGSKAKIRRYRMNLEEIYKAVKKAVENEGYKLVVLQSGEDDYYSDDDLVALINKIKNNLRVFIFISVGERSKDFYRRAFEAGASGSLFRFETSNPRLYSQMHPNHDLQSRLESLQMQIELGYYVASGGLIGLPGQTVGDLADDLLLVEKLGVPMLSSGPWIESRQSLLSINPKLEYRNPKQIPNHKSQNECHSEGSVNEVEESYHRVSGSIDNSEDSSLADSAGQNDNNNILPANGQPQAASERLRLTLNYIAAARFLMPEIKIPVTTALETLDPESGRHKALLAGANAFMFNITPEKYRDDYNLYDHKYIEREKVWQKYGLFKGEESYEMLEERLKI